MIDKGIPRHDYEIADANGKTIGKITSGTQSPSLGKAIAMGYVNVEYSRIDTAVYVKVRDKLLAAKVAKMPFE